MTLKEKTQKIKKNQLIRSLKSRHINMLAIGSSIGTGLFLGTGVIISHAGPGGALVAYLILAIMIYFLMTSLGEMATYLPVSGSFETYATKFIDPAFGFALGWNFWLSWASCLAIEILAASMTMKFWFPTIQTIYWSGLFLILILGINILSTRIFGEIEYWFAGIKVFTILIFLFIGILSIFGFIGSNHPGFSNWFIGSAPFVGGIRNIITVFLAAGFAFQGMELIGISAGESETPEKTIPKAISSLFWRILIFYIGSILVLGSLIPYNDPNLLKCNIKDIAVSPFTLVFIHAGLFSAATLINAVILTAVLSAANSSVYACSRMIYAMSIEGKAPSFFQKLNRHFVPINAVLFTSFIGMISFITIFVNDELAYQYLLNTTGILGFIAWIGIALSHYRFRTALIKQSKDKTLLKHRSFCFPFGPLFSLFLCVFIILGQGWSSYYIEGASLNQIIIQYIGIFFFLICFLYYKIKWQTKLIDLNTVNLNFDK